MRWSRSIEPNATLNPSGAIVVGHQQIRAAMEGCLGMDGVGGLHMEGNNNEVVGRQADGLWRFVIDNPFA